MYNPLLLDPTLLKDLDLDAKLVDLNKKYHFAYRMGQNEMVYQIAVAIESYKSEQMRRQYLSANRMVKKGDGGLDDLIKID